MHEDVIVSKQQKRFLIITKIFFLFLFADINECVIRAHVRMVRHVSTVRGATNASAQSAFKEKPAVKVTEENQFALKMKALT